LDVVSSDVIEGCGKSVAAARGFDSMKPTVLENSVWAGKASAARSGELPPAVFLIRVDGARSNSIRPEYCSMVLSSSAEKLGVDANTIDVRFHEMEFSFEKEVERRG
jgi:hypothetical protein